MWVIGGVFFFVLLEMLFTQSLSEGEPEPAEREPAEQQPAQNGAGQLRRRQVGEHTARNGSLKGAAAPPPQPPLPGPPAKQVRRLGFRCRGTWDKARSGRQELFSSQFC